VNCLRKLLDCFWDFCATMPFLIRPSTDQLQRKGTLLLLWYVQTYLLWYVQTYHNSTYLMRIRMMMMLMLTMMMIMTTTTAAIMYYWNSVATVLCHQLIDLTFCKAVKMTSVVACDIVSWGKVWSMQCICWYCIFYLLKKVQSWHITWCLCS